MPSNGIWPMPGKYSRWPMKVVLMECGSSSRIKKGCRCDGGSVSTHSRGKGVVGLGHVEVAKELRVVAFVGRHVLWIGARREPRRDQHMLARHRREIGVAALGVIERPQRLQRGAKRGALG